MKFLLDTHTFLWALFDDEQLSYEAAEAIKDPENDVYVSVITFWEISLKYSIGKIELEGIAPEELPEKAKEVGIETLTVTEQEAASFHNLPKLKHRDPFDRLIVWQAVTQNLTLVSKDSELRNYVKHGLTIFW